MVIINENELNSGVDELFDKMISVLRQRGFYVEDNKDFDPCHFLTEQEQTVFKEAIDFYNEIPF
ncbi:MAG: hypothetical protein IKH75_10660 [Ruminococcus sp.]|nr:hypothetical protein [Ruminococcus sp.]